MRITASTTLLLVTEMRVAVFARRFGYRTYRESGDSIGTVSQFAVSIEEKQKRWLTSRPLMTSLSKVEYFVRIVERLHT